jgi:hypothetical protein
MALNDRDPDDTTAESRRIAGLYKAASAEQPPKSLDHVVMGHARRPSEASVHQRPPWLRWRIPMAATAVVIVSASLVTLMLERGGEWMTERPRVSEMARSPTSATDVGGPSPSPPTKETITEQREREPEPDRQAPKRSGPALRPEAIPRTERTPGDAPITRETDVLERARSADASVNQEAPQPAAKPVSPFATESRSAAPAEMSAPQAPPRAAAGALGKRALNTSKEKESAPGPQPAGLSALVADLEGQPPSRWFDRIVALRRHGRREEAEEVLAEFKRRYASEPIPAGLLSNE